MFGAEEVADNERCFALTEALHNLETGELVELAENLGVKRLSCDSRMLD